MFKLRILSLGKGAANIAGSFDEYSEQTFYINTHRSEMDALEGNYFTPEAPKSRPDMIKLCVGGSGTGRSPGVGNKFADENRDMITSFLSHAFEGFNGFVLVIVGGGGGSGTGFAPVVTELMSDIGIRFGVIYTLPLKQEGSPTIPNAVNGLNNLVRVLRGRRVAPFFLIDNQLFYDEEETGGNYWQTINSRIAKILMFMDLFDRGMTDITTFNTLDENEFLRMFRLVKSGNDVGFNDIKTFDIDIDDPMESFREGMKAVSGSTVKGYDYRSAEGILVVMEKPEDDTDGDTAINDIFEAISKRFAGKKMLKSVIPVSGGGYTLSILFSGLNEPRHVNKINNDARRLIDKGSAKREKTAKISGVKFDDDFVDAF